MNKKLSNGLLVLIICLAFGVLLAGCGSSETGGQQAGTPNTSTEQSSGSEGDVITVRFGHNLMHETYNGQAALAFKEKLEELTDGKMVVELFPNQQLGSMREQVEQTQINSIQMTMQGASVYSPFIPSLAVLDLPFLLQADTVADVLQGDIGQDLLGKFDDAQLKGLTFMAQGFRQMSTKDFPVNLPADLKGVKYRSMPSELLIDTYAAWGANPTPVDFAELYNALQQGVVEAQDNDAESFYNHKLYEVQNNLIVSNHSYLAYVLSASKEWYDSLSPEFQQAVDEAAKLAGSVSFELAAENTVTYLKQIEETGMEVSYLSEDGIQQFTEASQPVYDKYLQSDFERDIFDRIQSFPN